jgi:hypothetical protein
MDDGADSFYRGSDAGRPRPVVALIEMTETKTSQPAAAYQAIGEYFVSFSRVEHELGQSVKATYGLPNNDAGDAIVAALGDVARKANLVRVASKFAKNANGSEASPKWKDKADETFTRVHRNNEDRVRLAHSLLQPNADGSVDFVRIRIDKGKVTGKEGAKWSLDNLREKIRGLDKLAEELKSLNGELQTFKYEIPANLSWMTSANFEPTMMQPHGMPAVFGATTGSV